jgi:SAM-dependent methyltransferase
MRDPLYARRMSFKDHFSTVAAQYQAFRPRYPPEFFEWLASVAPARDRAVDLGCGSGQASIGLAAHFGEVIGIEPSAEQVARAEAHPRVRYAVAPAEATGLPEASVDLALAAQAFHWFDPPRLARELARIARPGAVIAAATYLRTEVTPAVDAVVDRLYHELLGPHWPPERRHVESGYQTLPFPWPELEAPPFGIVERWTLDRFTGYLGTWSSAAAYRRATGGDAIALVQEDLARAWGPAAQVRPVRWPLVLRAGVVRPR